MDSDQEHSHHVLTISKTITLAIISAALILPLVSCGGYVRPGDEGAFPDISGKFGSKTLSIPVVDAVIDYTGAVQIVLTSGRLHIPRNREDGYDFLFLGDGYLSVIDTARLDNLWRRKFGEADRLTFTSAYICGDKFLRLIGVADSGWQEDKIDGRCFQQFKFQRKVPDKYFGVDLSGELGVWSDKELTPLPVWVDVGLDDKEQLVCYLMPDTPEHLNLSIYDKKYSEPYLVAGFSLGDRLISQANRITATDISIELQEYGHFRASCRLHFLPGTDPRGMRMNLPHTFRVDSVLDARGERLPFIKKYLRANFYIGARPVADSADFVTVYYRGKFTRAQFAGVDYPVNVTSWFPHLPQRNLGQFTIHYNLHKDLTLISVGRKISDTVSGDRRTVTYRSNADISYISFASGLYDTFADTVDGVPITLYVRKENNQGLFNGHIPRQVMADISGSFRAFSRWFGPPLGKAVNVVDQPFFTGQSSPELIHLSQVSFLTERGQGRFRSHEVAHQWWGHTAVPGSYREMWLSEGLSEYSAYLYLSLEKHDSTACRRMIDTWRRQVVQEGRISGLYARGYRAGPITLGVRLLQSYSPGDYLALIYSKAAAMLRMLHFEIDGPDYRTDFFLSLLAEYSRTYHGTQAGSVDFMKIAARRMGSKRAAEFFTQWLFGWKIPRFECRYSITPDERGRDLLEVEITVSDVDSGFVTPYPVVVEFADGTGQSFRIDGVGRSARHKLGPFPQPIAKVLFDPDGIILCFDKKVIGP